MRRLYVLLVSAVMALTLIAVAGASAAAPQKDSVVTGAGPTDYLATSSDKQGVAYPGYSNTGIQDASTQAMRKCQAAGSGKCFSDQWVRNGYIAYALADEDKYVAWAAGHTRGEATSQAVKYCQRGGFPGCAVSQSFRSHAYDKALPTQAGQL